MKCPNCGSQEITDCPSERDTIKYCEKCKFQWSTELPDGVLILMAVEYNKARRTV